MSAGTVDEEKNVHDVLRSTIQQLQRLGAGELKDAATAALASLESDAEACDAEEYFAPLKLGCESGQPKLMVLSLDCVESLLRRGLLSGKGPDPFQPDKGRCLMDTIVEAVCACAEKGDEAAQLALMRTLLSAVAHVGCVHDRSLMLGVRTCFALHRDAKSSQTAKQAQATLTQMLTVVTQRMELSSGSGAVPNEQSAAPDLSGSDPAELRQQWCRSIVDQCVDGACEHAGKGQPNEIGQLPGRYGWCVVCRASAPHYCLETKDPVCSVACKKLNLERLRCLGERGDDKPKVEAPVRDAVGADAPKDDSGNLYQKDAFMAFQSLCNLSMKDTPGTVPDARAVKSKRLALELVLSMLSNCGPVFRSSEKFISVLKSSLCISLIKNCVSPIPKIFGLALTIIVMLITTFKDHLKHEIGVFIEEIFIRILESGNSTYQHKQRVLQVFQKICTDALTSLELFLNFDCDVEEPNVFERMIDCLSRIAQGKYTQVEHANIITPQQESELKHLALEGLVTLMGSLCDWGRRMQEEQDKAGGLVENKSNHEEADDDDRFATQGSVPERSHSIDQTPNKAATAGEAILEARQRKLELQDGIYKFKQKAKKGVQFFIQRGFVEEDCVEMASFLTRIPLDKTVLGDWLGEPSAYNKSVMYALVDSLDFKGDELDGGLRKFLAKFRLPGEAQKIDRMMEKFAEKYYTDNPDVFQTADCAYVLAFSLIMLNTDQHSPNIKNRMSKEDFFRNNRGIDGGQDVPREQLEKLFNNILREPISLGEDDDKRLQAESREAAASSKKFELFAKETEAMVAKSKEIIRDKGKRSTTYTQASHLEYVRPLFEVACWPLLATFSVCLEMLHDTPHVELAVDGFKHCIRIAARFGLDTERDAFVSSLAKFTHLIGVKELKAKNLECVKALLAIGHSDGNCIGASWYDVLDCISRLERLQLIHSKQRPDLQFLHDAPQSPTTLRGNTRAKTHNGLLHVPAAPLVDKEAVEQANSAAVGQVIDQATIDAVLNRSASLSPDAVVQFVSALTRISKEEVFGETPRIFALQKLIEVADANMNRIRYVWSRVWRVLQEHFVEVATTGSKGIAMFAIDSLRQLAFKFLDKDELSNFHFQVEFLRPFEAIIASPNVSSELKEFIISILRNMVALRANNIKSGWKVVLSTLSNACSGPSVPDSLLAASFDLLKMVWTEHRVLFMDNYHEGVRCLAAFTAARQNPKLSLEAMQFLQESAEYMAKTDVAVDVPEQPFGVPSREPFDASKAYVAPNACSQVELEAQQAKNHPAAQWFPILRGFGSLVPDPRRDVRERALGSLFDVVQLGVHRFDQQTWQIVFRAQIVPVFDDLHHQLQTVDESTDRGSQWGEEMRSQLDRALKRLVELFGANEELAFMLEHVLRQIQMCVEHATESVARIGVEGFKKLLESGRQLKVEQWTVIANKLKELFDQSTPHRLNCGPVQKLPFDSMELVTQCVVQLLLIDLCKDLRGLEIPFEAHEPLLDALERSFEFAYEFNEQLEHRTLLKDLGFMADLPVVPGLLRQEREALSCVLQSLLQALQGEHAPEVRQRIAVRLQQLMQRALRNFLAKERVLLGLDDRDTGAVPKDMLRLEMDRQVKGYSPIIRDVLLVGLVSLPEESFEGFMAVSYGELIELVSCDDKGVRDALRDVLLRCGPLLARGLGPG